VTPRWASPGPRRLRALRRRRRVPGLVVFLLLAALNGAAILAVASYQPGDRAAIIMLAADALAWLIVAVARALRRTPPGLAAYPPGAGSRGEVNRCATPGRDHHVTLWQK
jgi:hypothetical protein